MSAFLLAADEHADEPEGGFGSVWLDDADAEDKTTNWKDKYLVEHFQT